MNKVKRSLITLVAVATLATNVLGMVGCKGDKTDFTKEVPVVAYDGSEVTVTFYHSMGQVLASTLDVYIEEFNEMYPNITIEHKSWGDYDEVRKTIAVEIGTGTSPSIAYCYPDHVALYNTSRAVVSLDGYIESELEVTDENGETTTMGFTEEQLDDFIDAYYDEGKVYGDDKMYTLPFSKSTEVMYYNKTKFEENGWTVPTTWEEMWALCDKIKEKYPENVIPLGYDSEANWFITMTEQMGTPYTSATDDEHYLFNTEENREFIEDLREKYDAGYFTTEELNGGTYTSSLFTQTQTNKPKCFMCIGSTGGATYQIPKSTDNKYPFEAGIAQIPQVDPENPKVIQQGPSLCMFKKSDPQEVAATWLFMKFLTTNVGLQAEFSMSNGYTPVIESVKEHPVYAAFLKSPDNLSGSMRNAALPAIVVAQTLAQADAYYVSPAFNGSSAARDQVGYLLQSCMTNALGNKTIAELVEAEFEKTINKLSYETV